MDSPCRTQRPEALGEALSESMGWRRSSGGAPPPQQHNNNTTNQNQHKKKKEDDHMTKTTKGTATAGNAGQKATAEDAVRLKSWGTTLEALEALQKAYLEVNAEYCRASTPVAVADNQVGRF